MSKPQDIPVTTAQIAQMAGVRPSAVSNWRRRHEDFPASIGSGPRGGDLFSRDAVTIWLRARDHDVAEASAGERIFSLLDSLRGVMATDEAVGLVLRWLIVADAVEPKRARQLSNVALHQDTAAVLAELRDVSRELAGHDDALWHFVEQQPEVAAPVLTECLGLSAQDRCAVLEYLLARDANVARSGRRTDADLAQLLVDLAGPIEGLVLDPATGAGDVLLAAAQSARGGQTVFLAGEAIGAPDAAFASARLAMHGLTSDIRREDSFSQPTFEMATADIVICDPPLGLRLAAEHLRPDDPRWFAGTPSASSADFAWIQYALWLTKPETGRAIVVTDLGATSAGGRADQIRRVLLSKRMVEAVIALPAGSAGRHTSIGLAVWVLRRPGANDPMRNVTFVDATREGRGSRRPLDHELREKIVECVVAGRAVTTLYDSGPVWVGQDQMAVAIAGDEQALAPDEGFDPRAWVGETLDDVLSTEMWVAGRAVYPAFPDALADIAAKWNLALDFSIHPRYQVEIPAPHRLEDLLQAGSVEMLAGLRVPDEAYCDQGTPVVRGHRSAVDQRHVDPTLFPDDVVLTKSGDLIVQPRPMGQPPLVALSAAEGEALIYPSICLRPREAWVEPTLLAAAVETAAASPRAATIGGTPRSMRRWLLAVEIPRLGEEEANVAAQALRSFDELEEALRSAAGLVSEWRAMNVRAIASGRASVKRVPEEAASE